MAKFLLFLTIACTFLCIIRANRIRVDSVLHFESLDGTEWTIRFKIGQNHIERLKQADLIIDSRQINLFSKLGYSTVGIEIGLNDTDNYPIGHKIQFKRKIKNLNILTGNKHRSKIGISQFEINQLRSSLMLPENKFMI
jgi:hypothetical protein